MAVLEAPIPSPINLGKIVDARTLKAHSVADRQAALRAAEQHTEATIDTQIEEITAYLSASVLADEVSRPSQNPGSSLWSRRDDSEDCPPHVATPKTSASSVTNTLTGCS